MVFFCCCTFCVCGWVNNTALLFSAHHLSGWSYRWPFLKAFAPRFYQLHEKGTSGQFKFQLKLPWYCLCLWMGYAVRSGVVFSSSISLGVLYFVGNFSFCYQCSCNFLFSVLDIPGALKRLCILVGALQPVRNNQSLISNWSQSVNPSPSENRCGCKSSKRLSAIFSNRVIIDVFVLLVRNSFFQSLNSRHSDR